MPGGVIVEKVNFLPLGSLVLLNGGEKKIMIISRAIAMKLSGENVYFEYGGCTYPEGLLGDAVAYFNNEDVKEILDKGYVDDEESEMIKKLNLAISAGGFRKITPGEWNEAKNSERR